MKQLTFLLVFIGLFSCQNAEMEQQLAEANTAIENLKTELLKAQTPKPVIQPGFIHSVFLWLKEDLPSETIQQFEKDLAALKKIETIQNCYIGPAAGTPRAVVDNSYDYALIIHFKDKAGQAAYQVDPIHKYFVDTHKDNFKTVKVYDNLVE